MSLPVIIRPDAQMDIRTIHDDLEQVRAGLGGQFMARLRAVLERIEAFPEIYGVIWQDVRSARLKQFRYIVYYVVFSDRIEIIAMTHGSQDASVWQSRV
ncbi:MAG: type II toxin-antitoxin system RelE/ParE family toxin [Gemmataceae bacterium]